jgi:hypothetical protein
MVNRTDIIGDVAGVEVRHEGANKVLATVLRHASHDVRSI